MRKESMSKIRFKKRKISNLNQIKAGGPPPPPGSNSCVQEITCVSCEEANM
ncbi:hypothetical protein [Kordia sp.]|uniref:hypothetical protein n=1 Tax=Kordia sp. TaxID=1965332 RepID=UPI003D29D98A